MYKISFYVPESHLESVKNALFQAGVGQLGNYERCSWQVKGEGQFLAKTGSNPFVGKSGKITKISEYKVEMVCLDDFIQQAVAALKSSHPYETPAYQVIKMETM